MDTCCELKHMLIAGTISAEYESLENLWNKWKECYEILSCLKCYISKYWLLASK